MPLLVGAFRESSVLNSPSLAKVSLEAQSLPE